MTRSVHEAKSVRWDRVLPAAAGRSIAIRLESGQEAIEVRSPSGRVEVSITFTETGPSVRLSACDLSIDSPGDVSLRCETFSVEAPGGMELKSETDIRVTGRELLAKMDRDVDLRGRFIRLNSPEEASANQKAL